ncbi:DinB family protein [Bacillus sp. DX1.1]|uniref:DinB family protein n=1 Tax=unclassified Bacillus (in: firmicutes) TaxID=185979 RepID=UPI0025705B75|nr:MULTISPECIES: DinB family protein [unclassified Bacillus (in: firmicutes)]MDM5154315.1 DinB family protein [Bacillus sp. DX1.1]WJE83227.1 DinB family protein [Bacillus sp. DX3.1]
MLKRPQTSEYNPYAEKYIELVPDGNLLDILKKQQEETNDLLRNVSKEQGEYRYEEGKWSLKEVVGHMADIERVMSYHLLVAARGDRTTLPSFDKDVFVMNAEFNRMRLEDITLNFSIVRQCTCSLFASIPSDAWMRTGTILNHETTARALAYIIAGHELHHRSIIKERYLSLI